MGNWRLNVDLSLGDLQCKVPLQNKTLHFQKKLIIYQLAMNPDYFWVEVKIGLL